jgi:hypothetical protein
VQLNGAEDLIYTEFRAGNSYCKAVLCLLAHQDPRDFQDNAKVILDNSNLVRANSRNYHHFFPKAFLRKQKTENENSLMNITFISDQQNKSKIKARAPSSYIGEFVEENEKIDKALQSHFIELNGFGIESNDYSVFLRKRAERIYQEIVNRLELTKPDDPNSEVTEIIAAGETDSVEFKSTLRFDLHQGKVNKKLEYVIAKTVAAFMNTEGGSLLIGVDDSHNVLGLDADIQSLPKQNIDGFELHLVEVLKKYIGVNAAKYVKITFPEIDDEQICFVRVSKSGSPIFTTFEGREDFFVRMGCSSQPLSREEQSKYETSHWT